MKKVPQIQLNEVPAPVKIGDVLLVGGFGMGGAMDLASGAKKLIITMGHTNRRRESKIVERCTLPLTAKGAVDIVITELAVFAFEEGQLILKELMPGATLEEVRAKTAANFAVKL